MRSERSQRAASVASWVTSTSVVSASRFNSNSRSVMRAPVVRASDGYGLARLVAPILDGDVVDTEAGARALEASDMWGV